MMIYFCSMIVNYYCLYFTSIKASDSQQCSRQWSSVDDHRSSTGGGLCVSLLPMLRYLLERKVS